MALVTLCWPNNALLAPNAAQVFGHGYEENAQDEEQAAAELNAALATLTQLTSLLIGSAVPPNGWTALAELPSLQRLCLFGCDSLPAGAWCRSLHELGLNGECLQRSCGVLESAEQLRHVVVWAHWSKEQPLDAAVLRWAARHPPLRQLQVSEELLGKGSSPREQAQIDALMAPWVGAMAGAVQRLRQERPGLQVSRGGWSMRSAFVDSFSQVIEVEI